MMRSVLFSVFLWTALLVQVLGDEYIPMSSQVDNHQHFDTQWNGEGALFYADAIEVTFGQDEIRRSNKNSSLKFVENTTSFGKEVSLIFDESHVVRFYFIQPRDDWRTNQSYYWKLEQSWMPNNDWVFWNVEEFVDSGIKVTETDTLFHSDVLVFNYKPRLKGRARETWKLVAKNVVIGSYLSNGYNVDKLKTFNPCGAGSPCSVIDGRITCGRSSRYNVPMLSIMIYATAGLVVCALTLKRRLFFGHCTTSDTGYSPIRPAHSRAPETQSTSTTQTAY